MKHDKKRRMERDFSNQLDMRIKIAYMILERKNLKESAGSVGKGDSKVDLSNGST